MKPRVSNAMCQSVTLATEGEAVGRGSFCRCLIFCVPFCSRFLSSVNVSLTRVTGEISTAAVIKMIGRTGRGWILAHVGIFGSRKSQSYLVSCGDSSRHTQSRQSRTIYWRAVPNRSPCRSQISGAPWGSSVLLSGDMWHISDLGLR